jgi:predicted anti-sigma-YlaC factor YlaD
VDCEAAVDLVEAIAAGDLAPDAATRAHLESCPSCAAALAAAGRVHALLLAVDTPTAPASFTPDVLQRIRRDRWRTEQHIDRLFNVAIAAAVAIVVVGIAAMLNVDGVLALAGGAWVLLRDASRDAVKQAAPLIFTYVAAAGLLASALVMWWWAERKFQY